MISSEAILESAGEESLENVLQIVLRNSKYRCFNERVILSLSQVTTISLSGNEFSSLEQFGALSNLRELNLNFNKISNLRGPKKFPALPSLKKLFLSCNNLTNECIGHFPSQIPNVQTICLFRNKINRLNDAIHVLKQLTHLRSLDFAGNPCTKNNVSFKHQILYHIPTLNLLDDEDVQKLDIELAKQYMDKKESRKVSRGNVDKVDAVNDTVSVLSRPSTAPACRSKILEGRPLFQSKQLNTDPTLLQYLALTSTQTPLDWNMRNFKNRGEDLEQDEAMLKRVNAQREAQKVMTEKSSISQTSQTIHSLVSTIEHLRIELAQNSHKKLKKQAFTESTDSDMSDSDNVDVKQLILENRKLHAENANMYFLQEENKKLKIDNAELSTQNQKLLKLKETKYTMHLEQEIQLMRSELDKLKEVCYVFVLFLEIHFVLYNWLN